MNVGIKQRKSNPILKLVLFLGLVLALFGTIGSTSTVYAKDKGTKLSDLVGDFATSGVDDGKTGKDSDSWSMTGVYRNWAVFAPGDKSLLTNTTRGSANASYASLINRAKNKDNKPTPTAAISAHLPYIYNRVGLDHQVEGTLGGLASFGKFLAALPIAIAVIAIGLIGLLVKVPAQLLQQINPFEILKRIVLNQGAPGKDDVIGKIWAPAYSLLKTVYTSLANISIGVGIIIMLVLIVMTFLGLHPRHGGRAKGFGASILNFVRRAIFIFIVPFFLAIVVTDVLGRLADVSETPIYEVSLKPIYSTWFDFQGWVENSRMKLPINSQFPEKSTPISSLDNVPISRAKDGQPPEPPILSDDYIFYLNANFALEKNSRAIAELIHGGSGNDSIKTATDDKSRSNVFGQIGGTLDFLFNRWASSNTTYSSADWEGYAKGMISKKFKGTKGGEAYLSDPIKAIKDGAWSNGSKVEKGKGINNNPYIRDYTGFDDTKQTDTTYNQPASEYSANANTLGGEGSVIADVGSPAEKPGITGGLSTVGMYNYLNVKPTDSGIIYTQPQNLWGFSSMVTHQSVGMTGRGVLAAGRYFRVVVLQIVTAVIGMIMCFVLFSAVFVQVPRMAKYVVLLPTGSKKAVVGIFKDLAYLIVRWFTVAIVINISGTMIGGINNTIQDLVGKALLGNSSLGFINLQPASLSSAIVGSVYMLEAGIFAVLGWFMLTSLSTITRGVKDIIDSISSAAGLHAGVAPEAIARQQQSQINPNGQGGNAGGNGNDGRDGSNGGDGKGDDPINHNLDGNGEDYSGDINEADGFKDKRPLKERLGSELVKAYDDTKGDLLGTDQAGVMSRVGGDLATVGAKGLGLNPSAFQPGTGKRLVGDKLAKMKRSKAALKNGAAADTSEAAGLSADSLADMKAAENETTNSALDTALETVRTNKNAVAEYDAETNELERELERTRSEATDLIDDTAKEQIGEEIAAKQNRYDNLKNQSQAVGRQLRDKNAQWKAATADMSDEERQEFFDNLPAEEKAEYQKLRSKKESLDGATKALGSELQSLRPGAPAYDKALNTAKKRIIEEGTEGYFAASARQRDADSESTSAYLTAVGETETVDVDEGVDQIVSNLRAANAARNIPTTPADERSFKALKRLVRAEAAEARAKGDAYGSVELVESVMTNMGNARGDYFSAGAGDATPLERAAYTKRHAPSLKALRRSRDNSGAMSIDGLTLTGGLTQSDTVKIVRNQIKSGEHQKRSIATAIANTPATGQLVNETSTLKTGEVSKGLHNLTDNISRQQTLRRVITSQHASETQISEAKEQLAAEQVAYTKQKVALVNQGLSPHVVKNATNISKSREYLQKMVDDSVYKANQRVDGRVEMAQMPTQPSQPATDEVALSEAMRNMAARSSIHPRPASAARKTQDMTAINEYRAKTNAPLVNVEQDTPQTTTATASHPATRTTTATSTSGGNTPVFDSNSRTNGDLRDAPVSSSEMNSLFGTEPTSTNTNELPPEDMR